MNIKSLNARIETASPGHKEEHSAFIDVYGAVGGFAAVARFNPSLNGHFVLALRADSPRGMFLIAVPSERWMKDVEDDGYTVIQTLSPRLLAAGEQHTT